VPGVVARLGLATDPLCELGEDIEPAVVVAVGDRGGRGEALADVGCALVGLARAIRNWNSKSSSTNTCGTVFWTGSTVDVVAAAVGSWAAAATWVEPALPARAPTPPAASTDR